MLNPDRVVRPALVVDLDGTMTAADITIESFVRFVRAKVWNIVLLVAWLLRGRSFAKAMVARRMPVNAATIIARPEIVALIEQARSEGRPVILASGSHRRNVQRIAGSLGLFDLAIGTDARCNLTGARKLTRLRALLGDVPFDYIGDSRADIPLWQAARIAYSTGIQPKNCAVESVTTPRSRWRAIRKSLRMHQWAKNALVFVPVVTSGLLLDGAVLAKATLAAVLFSLVASSIYQLNDVLDIESDRAHPKKCLRPLAAGTLSIPQAIVLAGGLLLLPLGVAAWALGTAFTATLIAYLALTTAYSIRLKAVMTLDVITLGCLYTLRIIAGAIAIGVTLSFWLLLFSVFFFLSLGYLKRYTELSFATDPSRLLSGRGYVGSDLDIVAMAGVSSGMVSILVMGLFVRDIEATGVYESPALLWGLCLCLLYWINRVWMMARRGQVDGDPVAFAVKDRRSVAVALIMAAIMAAARFVPLG